MQAQLLLERGNALWGCQQGPEAHVASDQAPQQPHKQPREACQGAENLGLRSLAATRAQNICDLMTIMILVLQETQCQLVGL